MNHSEVCPICKGSGKQVFINYYVSGSSYYPFTSVPLLYNETTCRGCKGKGWVIVPDEDYISNQNNHIPYID